MIVSAFGHPLHVYLLEVVQELASLGATRLVRVSDLEGAVQRITLALWQ